jgi:hypothetical protein
MYVSLGQFPCRNAICDDAELGAKDNLYKAQLLVAPSVEN